MFKYKFICEECGSEIEVKHYRYSDEVRGANCMMCGGYAGLEEVIEYTHLVDWRVKK